MGGTDHDMRRWIGTRRRGGSLMVAAGVGLALLVLGSAWVVWRLEITPASIGRFLSMLEEQVEAMVPHTVEDPGEQLAIFRRLTGGAVPPGYHLVRVEEKITPVPMAPDDSPVKELRHVTMILVPEELTLEDLYVPGKYGMRFDRSREKGTALSVLATPDLPPELQKSSLDPQLDAVAAGRELRVTSLVETLDERVEEVTVGGHPKRALWMRERFKETGTVHEMLEVEPRPSVRVAAIGPDGELDRAAFDALVASMAP